MAVCLWTDRVDVARVVAAEAKPRVLIMASYRTGASESDALDRIGRQYKLSRVHCTTLLGTADYQLLQLEIPPGDLVATGLRELLRERLRETLDQPLEHVGFDAIRIPTREFAPGRAEMAYVVVAGNASIAPRVQAFHAAGVALKAIDIPELAQRNIAALCETPGRALAFLAFSENDGLLTFTWNGELYMSRHIEIGSVQLLTDDIDRRATLFDRIGLEVQRSLDNFDRQFGYLPLSRLVLGPMPDSGPLQSFLHDHLGLVVDVLDLADVLEFPDIPELRQPARQAQCLLTLGAALRDDAAGVIS